MKSWIHPALNKTRKIKDAISAGPTPDFLRYFTAATYQQLIHSKLEKQQNYVFCLSTHWILTKGSQ